MKSELKFGLNVVLLLIAAFVFNIVAHDYGHIYSSWSIGYAIKENLHWIQDTWSLHIVIIAIVTAILVLFRIKSGINLWECATKIMWLTFLVIIIVHLAGIYWGW